MTTIDQRRQRDGDAAIDVIDREPAGDAETAALIETLSEGIRALQSLDDLGPEANRDAWDKMQRLQRRRDELAGADAP